MTTTRDTLLLVAGLLGACVLLAAAVRLGLLLWHWSANSPYAWGIG